MELHQLRYFVAVAELENFTRAAERCHVSQPSLSQQIINLEREIGRPLLERLGKRTRLTETGKLLYDRAVTILRGVGDLERDVRSASAADGGTITVGAIPTIAPYFLPGFIAALRKQLPRVDVVIQEDFTERLVTLCRAGEIDLALLALPVAAEPLAIQTLFEEELLLALAKNHPLARLGSITVDLMGREPFVLLSEMHCLGEQIVSFCKQQACLPAISCRSAQLLTVQELVATGHGVSLIPTMAAARDGSKSRTYRPIAAPRPTRRIGVIWHEGRFHSPLARRILTALAEYASDFAAVGGRFRPAPPPGPRTRTTRARAK